MPDEFDVFLSHNSRDKPVVEEIAARLRNRGLRVWLDKHELPPGLPWQEGLEEGLRASRSVAVFIGEDGLGTWQQPEMRVALTRSMEERFPVIPVLLPGCPGSPQLPSFLKALTWVDLRQGLTDDGISLLERGIAGAPSAPRLLVEHPVRSNPPRSLRVTWTCGIAVSALVMLIAIGVKLPLETLVALFSSRPEIYEVRIQVLSPQGLPVAGATVRASTGDEAQRLPEGWGEIEIPSAKVPADGRITLRAEHPEWGGNQKVVLLRDDKNVQVEIRLKPPESWLRGRVIDESGRALAGVRVSVHEGPPGEARTDAEGRFALKLQVPPETQIRLRAEYEGLAPAEPFCFAGRDTCSILLEER